MYTPEEQEILEAAKAILRKPRNRERQAGITRNNGKTTWVPYDARLVKAGLGYGWIFTRRLTDLHKQVIADTNTKTKTVDGGVKL